MFLSDTHFLLKVNSIWQWRIQDFTQGGVDPLGGYGPLVRVLFGENVCENIRIGSCRVEGMHRKFLFVYPPFYGAHLQIKAGI